MVGAGIGKLAIYFYLESSTFTQSQNNVTCADLWPNHQSQINLIRTSPVLTNPGVNLNQLTVSVYLAPTFYWPFIESSLGIVGACLPTLRPIFRSTTLERLTSSLQGMLSFFSSRRSQSRSGRTYTKHADSSSSAVIPGVNDVDLEHGGTKYV